MHLNSLSKFTLSFLAEEN